MKYWLLNRKIDFKNIFPTMLNKPIQYACWSSDKKIFKILENGLLDFHGIDGDNDTGLCIE